MGSLRNPIGPLPSSIYWRRRAVALGLLGLLVLVMVWLFALGGGDGSEGSQSEASDGKGSSDTTITPGPTPSGPHNSQRPGGRDDSGNGGGAGSGGAAGGGTSGGSGGGAGTGGGSGGAGSVGGFGGGAGLAVTGDGKAVPAGSSLPDCTSGSVKISVRSVKASYRPDEKPKFELVVQNSGGSACKVNFGTAAALLKITDSKGEEHVWASDDCPRGTGPVLFEVPGSGETKRTLEWDRKRSAPRCATPSAAAAAPGTYKVEVKVAGVTERTEFVLENA
ncbi:hypothetical protein AB0F13_19005 [Streptomyces sp. NPDC026206]|uniref:hypothetical protein n=1 Tax=Streptomyces sp. NPDC026206 TaxID=3157089 RepID=UPI0033F0B232